MKTLLSILSLALLSVEPVYAGDDHNHEASVEAAPHGGTLRDSPPYKVELVLKGDEASIYVYDGKLKPVKLEKETAVGELRFPKEKKAREIVFKKNGEVYSAKLNGISKVHRYDLHVKLEIESKKILADFGVDNIH